MNDRINAIVLSINEYRENDLLLNCLCKEAGFISIVAKSARKITSHSHFYEGNSYEFIINLKDGKNIYTAHGNKLLKNFYDLNNLKLMSFKNIIFEMTLKSREFYEESMYDNLYILINSIDEHNMYLLGSVYVSYMCCIHGIRPNVDGCVVCGNKKIYSLSNSKGGFICREHLKSEKIMESEALKKFRLINKANFNNYDLINNVEYTKEDFRLNMDFFIFNSDIKLKTYEFFNSMF